MEVAKIIPCPKCPKTMVKIGAGRRRGDLVEIHYHCWSCRALLTIDAKTGQHEDGLSDQALAQLSELQMLRLIGSAALPGDKYPWSRVPRAERPLMSGGGS